MTRRAQVSVVIPAFNSEKFIGAALASVLAQTRPALEVIVVNDGSTDSTGDCAAAWVDRFAPGALTILRHENRGLSTARNRGILASRGDVIALLDADDEFMPGHLAALAAIFDAHPEVSLAFGDMLSWRDGRGSTSLVLRRVRDALLGVSRPASLAGALLLGPEALAIYLSAPSILPSSCLVARDAFATAGLFDAANIYGEDVDLFCRLHGKGHWAWRNEVTGRRREHGDNMSGPTYSEKTERGALWSYARLRRFSPTLSPTEAAALDRLVDEAVHQVSYHATRHGFSAYCAARRSARAVAGRRLRPAPRLLLRSILYGWRANAGHERR